MDPQKLINILQADFPEVKQTSGIWINLNCPFCTEVGLYPDTGSHLGINFDKEYTHCWKCKRSDQLSFFLYHMKVEYSGGLSEGNGQVEIPHYTAPYFPHEYKSIQWAKCQNDLVSTKAVEYTKKRIGLDLAEQLCIGVCYTGVYANRIVVPIFNPYGDIIYWVARAVFDFVKPKVKNPPGSRPDILFNWNVAQRFDEIFIMEGIFGALVSFPYGVATLGKEVTESQLLTIIRSDVKIINIVLDGNAIKDAYDVAEKILSLTNRIKIRVLELKQECQPDDVGKEHIFNLKKITPFYTGNIFI